MIDALLLTAALYTGKGAELPEYRGAHYTPRAERFLECVAARESSWPRKGSWTADGPYGSGAYQFTGRTWDVYAERAGYPEWVGERAASAPPYVQTEVAYVALNPYPRQRGLEGAHHWSPEHALTIGKTVRGCSDA